jgi:hypothetical protein
VRPSRRFIYALALALTLLFGAYPATAQAAAAPVVVAPAVVAPAIGLIPIKVTPKVIQPANGKLPASMTLVVSESNCDDKTGTDLTQGVSAPYSLAITGSGLTLASQSVSKCAITAALTIDPNAAGPYQVILVDKAKNTVGLADIGVLDSSAGAIPPGLNPDVDVMWEVMSQNNCSDAFGKRVAQSLYCVQLKIGNNSGHPIQIAGIGFTNKLKALAAIGIPQVTIANSSYASTRAVLLQSQVWSNRNIIANSLQGAGLIMAGFTPFFSGSRHTDPKLHYTTLTTIVSGAALQAYNLIVPDPTVPQLKSLDDQSFRDNMVIPNNSHTQTVVFVEKQVLTTALQELNIELKDAAAITQKQAQTARAEAQAAKTTASTSKANAASSGAETAAKMDAETKTADAERLQVTAETLNKIATSSQKTIRNSTRPAWHPWKLKGQPDPLLVKLALGNVVIVGDEIEYLQRVQIQSSAAPSAVSPLTASPSSLAFGDQMVAQPSSPKTVTLTNTGSASITNLNLQLSGANKSEFNIPPDQNTCTATLAPSTPCTVSLTFTPDPTQSVQAGRSANLDVSFSPGSTPLTIPLSGNAKTPTTPTVVFSQTTLPFGTQKAGSGQSKATLTIVNFMGAALASLTIPAPAGANAADFATPPDNKCAANLNAGDNCSVTWTFMPPAAATGARTAKVAVTYTVAGAAHQQDISLSGTAQ